MKTAILNLALVASATAAVQARGHAHGHFHQKKGDSNMEKREYVTTYVPKTVTVYKLDDEDVSAEDAKAGLDKGEYIVIGETTPTFSPPAPASTSSVQDAQFYQKATTSSAVVVATPTSYPAAATTTTKSSSGSGGKGVDAEFPSGELDCTSVPTDYGAITAPWLGYSGWAGIQYTPNYKKGDSSISYIVGSVDGDNCASNSWCGYGCPAGYVQTQWPEDCQGATGQSIGGLYCNSAGKLELSRPEYKTLCTKGAGGVKIVNKMSKGAAVCRTWYPGSEAMVIPLDVQAGGTYDLANVESAKYYNWQGKTTTLQYYVNQKGVSVENGCQWNSPTNPKDGGNWAPTNIGVGKDAYGITYLSLFPNWPTTTATLDFDIVISGDVSGSCSLISGVYEGAATGCTVGIKDGGSATITFKDSGY